MIHVQGGTFIMGRDTWRANAPIHEVTVNDFHIGEFPVTNLLWETLISKKNNRFSFIGENRPMENVSWFDAVVFCNALNILCNLEPCYFSDAQHKIIFGKTNDGFTFQNEGIVYLKADIKSYRLPIEIEWEFAARGGTYWRNNLHFSGGNDLNNVGWYDENSHNETKPIGLKFPNQLGIYDMSGNVWEWCYDWYNALYKTSSDPTPLGPDKGNHRVLRGGCWHSRVLLCGVAHRFRDSPSNRSNDIGFRLVLSSSSLPHFSSLSESGYPR